LGDTLRCVLYMFFINITLNNQGKDGKQSPY
jgi:hypothetical protein